MKDTTRNKAIPVYLTEQQYSALREAAAQYGCSMAALVRDLVQAQLVEGSPPPTDISDLAGSVQTGHPTDIATERQRMLEEAMGDLR